VLVLASVLIMAASAGARGGNKLMALFKQGWNEIPEVMGSAIYGFIGMGMAFYGMHRIVKYDLNNHRYKTTYTVMRPDDERVNRINKFDNSPNPTRTPPSLRSCY